MGERPSDWSSRRRKALRRDNYTCQNCGRQGGPNGDAELHVHHSVPVSNGGSHQLSNLITHCKECHDAIHGNRMAPTAQQVSESDGAPSMFDKWVIGFAILITVTFLTGGLGLILLVPYTVLYIGYNVDGVLDSGSRKSTSRLFKRKKVGRSDVYDRDEHSNWLEYKEAEEEQEEEEDSRKFW